jgi:hypothetical protein
MESSLLNPFSICHLTFLICHLLSSACPFQKIEALKQSSHYAVVAYGEPDWRASPDDN